MKKLRLTLMCFVVLAAAVFITGCPKSGADEPQAAQAAPVISEYLKVVNFDFNKSEISASAANILKENAATLKQNANVKILVEGHCDNKGSADFNLALGQRRAAKVKEYYVSLGIASNRISITSFGKSKPVDNAETESAYAKNRRAETKLVLK